MKKITLKVLFVFVFIGNLTIVNAQCLPDGIIFTSQSQIEDFPSNYPTCTQILGNLIIEETISGNITDLSGLSQINSLAAELKIDHNTALNNLDGLNNLQNVSGNIRIFNNNGLVNLIGLESLNTVNEVLAIYSNTSLQSFSGIDNITVLGGLLIAENLNLSNIQALSNLQSINGYLDIETSSLTNLNGLENVAYINGSIEIIDNFLLTNIEGLKNIDPLQISLFLIKQNNSLSNCAVESLCNYFGQIPSAINIENNAPGCNNLSEVEAACALGTAENQISEIKIYPNPTNGTIEISGLSEGNIAVFDSQGRIVKKITLGENSQSISELSPGVYFLKIQSGLYSVTKQLVKL